MKNDFATKILLRNVRGCVKCEENGIGKRSFFDDVDAWKDLRNIEEQPKSIIVH